MKCFGLDSGGALYNTPTKLPCAAPGRPYEGRGGDAYMYSHYVTPRR